jgi:hypothetical protein
MTKHPPSLGGYLELELGPRSAPPHAGAMALQSARAAFLLLLRSVQPGRIWLPWYLCETMAEQARRAAIPIQRYGLAPGFGVGDSVELAEGELILVVDYFGLCGAQVAEALTRFGAARVVVDASHSFYAEPTAALATLYSPRKFVGVPDGGLLATRLPIEAPAAEDEGSLARLQPLLRRLAEGPESAYPLHLQAEASLEAQEPMRMSRLTRRLLESADFARIAERRRENFAALDRLLGRRNAAPLALAEGAVPLSYPWFGGGQALREQLQSQRIYCPRFWPHLATMAGLPAFERYLYDECIPLPCGQGCEADDLARIVAAIDAHAA